MRGAVGAGGTTAAAGEAPDDVADGAELGRRGGQGGGDEGGDEDDVGIHCDFVVSCVWYRGEEGESWLADYSWNSKGVVLFCSERMNR